MGELWKRFHMESSWEKDNVSGYADNIREQIG